MKGRLGILVVATVLMLTNAASATATVGPVRVVLNTINNKARHARANTIPYYVIYFRYNVDIKEHQWVKVWFPVGEASRKQSDICGQLPALNGILESQRFIPNEKYFEKYPNSQEKEVGKLYKIIDHMGNTNFLDTSGIDEACKSGDCGFVKDSSGLGYWMLGSVMPPLPRDKAKRMEELLRIIRGSAIGYNPCSNCQGYPIIENTLTERSFLVGAMGDYDSWRKGYNSIDYNFSRNCGIMLPATPGRYRIAIATESEPEPVESESFILPCSDVSDVFLEDIFLDNSGNALTVNFKTGEGGALDGGNSEITLKLPSVFAVPKKFPAKCIKINGAFVNSSPQIETGDGYNQIKIIVPTDVNNLGSAKIEFLSNSGLACKLTKDPMVVEVSTTSEPNFIKSVPLALASTPATVVAPSDEYKNSFISCRAPLPDGEKLKAGTEIKLNFPEGFKLPKSILPSNVSVMGIPTKALAVDKNTVKITLPADVEYFIAISVRAQAGITNPKAGKYSFSITIPKDTYDCGQVEITQTKGFITNLDLSDSQGSVVSKYSFRFAPSSQTKLAIGDIFRVVFPEGTVLPKDFDLEKVTVGRKTAISTGVNGTVLAIATPVEISSVNPVDVSIDIGIKNPKKHGAYTLSVNIGENEPIVSEEYYIEPAPLKSWIYFKDPDKANCGDWFNKPPILGFDCLNPEAKITFWFNNQPDKSVNYGGEARLMPGSQRAKITWQAEYNGVKEEPQTINFYLDTITPPITVTEPKTDKYTNQKSIIVQGERGFVEMLTDGDNEKYQVTDSIFIRQNGQETQLLTGEIYETVNSGSIEYKFKHTVNLKEGPNVIEFIGRDQACNETIIKKTITLDTEPPRVEILSPKENDVFTIGDSVLIKVKTEKDAIVYIDKTLAKLESTEGDNGFFSVEANIEKEKNMFIVKVIDESGNSSIYTVFVYAKPKKTVITLTLDKKEWTVNGTAQTPLKAAPTSKFNDPKLKALNGTTYMPIAQVAPLLNCKVEWNAKEKKVTLTQTPPNGKIKVLELWLNKTKGKIDGKEVTYNSKGTIFPTVIGGKTLLPLRFVAENLGASVQYDAKTKQITLIYPK